MFIPLHDSNKLEHISLQYVTLGLIAANVVVYLMANLQLAAGTYQAAVYSFGYIPAVVNDIVDLPPEAVLIPEELSLVSYSFLHADFMHLAGNMLFLWVFGDNVEDALGHVRFAVFYVLSAAAGALLHGLIEPESIVPLIGASGAVSGIIGAYLMLHPRVLVWVLAFGRIPVRLPAVVPLAIWIGYQFVAIVLTGSSDISWAAHIGGVLAGMLMVVFMRRSGVPLFDREVVTPRAATFAEPRDGKKSEPRSRQRPWGRGD